MPKDINVFLNEIIIKPRFCEVDALQIVHHSRFVQWIEEANFNFMDHVLGISKKELVETDMFNPIKSIELQYKNHVNWVDTVRVKSYMHYNQFAMFTMVNVLECAKNPNKVFAHAKVKMVITDKSLKLKILAPDFLINRIKAAEKANPSYFCLVPTS
ncbi:thioesterase family protein [Muricauda sp. MAR_2010_75]|uniref:acyl-CoA thioesterase n=1 Tax=Allomuricauda sp. MAR_2010_75 TaxID=1250232 RepID=UPI000690F947|nr:acyl-CoA thioesterase [Muricauda sp. MAR_2010_75]